MGFRKKLNLGLELVNMRRHIMTASIAAIVLTLMGARLFAGSSGYSLTCGDPATTTTTVPNIKDPLGPPMYVLVTTKIKVTIHTPTNGDYVVNYAYQMFKLNDGKPDIDTIDRNGKFQQFADPQSARQFFQNLCGNSVPAPAPPHLRPSGAAAATNTTGISGEYAGAFAMGDFNGDGNPDSAALNAQGITVSLMDAIGNVTSTNVYPFPNGGASIITTDFNGDGKLDLAAVVNPPSDPGNITVLLGNGDGTFGKPSTYPAGLYPFYLISGDFNGDGKPRSRGLGGARFRFYSGNG
jgi:hypothetical protein